MPSPAFLTRDTKGPLDFARDTRTETAVGYRRGFPDVVRCKEGVWTGFVHPFSRAAPLARLELADRRHHRHLPREWVWARGPDTYFDAPDASLGSELFDELAEPQSVLAVYPSKKSALDALSAACLGRVDSYGCIKTTSTEAMWTKAR